MKIACNSITKQSMCLILLFLIKSNGVYDITSHKVFEGKIVRQLKSFGLFEKKTSQSYILYNKMYLKVNE